jgi:ATP-dependent Lhr-like helicase
MSLARRSKGSIAPAEAWFASRGWKPFAFQKETWKAQLSGSSGLLHCPTGSGKTLAVWMGPLLDFLARPVDPSGWTRRRGHDPAPPLLALWVTPLRALAADTAGALLDPVVGMGLPWTIESRTGDTSASTKQRQRRQLPTALITTPESLTLLLSYPESKEHFANLRTVIVDEWHELIGTKRGIQTELALGRLRAIAPRATRWGVSATLGNLDEALRCLVGSSGDLDSAKIVHGGNRKKVVLDSDDRTFSVGGSFGDDDVAAGRGSDRRGLVDARFHQHPQPDGTLVSGVVAMPARLGGFDRAASRITRQSREDVGRRCDARRQIEGGRLHQQS